MFDVHPSLDDFIDIFGALRRRAILIPSHYCANLFHVQGGDITESADQVLEFYILGKQGSQLLLIVGQKQHIPDCVLHLLGLYINLLPVFEIYFLVDNF